MHEAARISGGELFLPDSIEAEEFPRLSIVPAEGYALLPFHQAFPVREVLLMAHEATDVPLGHKFYKVDFGSLLKPDADRAEIARLDNEAHREAMGSPGFGLYFRGDLDAEGHNRSFCVWRSVEEGMLAARRPAHQAASQAVGNMYEWYQVSMHQMWLDDQAPLGFNSALVGHYASDGQLHIAV